MRMKIILLMLIIVLQITPAFSKLNMIVQEIDNLTAEDRYDYIKVMFNDTIQSFLDGNIYNIKYEKDLSISDQDKNDMFSWAYRNFYEILLNGYFVVNDGDVYLTIRCYDIATETMKINIRKVVKPDDTFYIVIREIAEELNNEINRVFFTELDIIQHGKDMVKQAESITNQGIEYQLNLSAGIIYGGCGFMMLDKSYFNIDENIEMNDFDENAHFDISSLSNSYLSAVMFDIKMSIMVKRGNAFHGFFISSQIPLNIRTNGMFLSTHTRTGYLFNTGDFTFKWSAEFYYAEYSKYGEMESNGHYREITIRQTTGGLGFYFGYTPEKIPHIFEIGLSILSPYMITIQKDGSNLLDLNSIIIPVSLYFYYAYFFSENIGIYIDTTIMAHIARYYTNMWIGGYNNLIYLGRDLGLAYKISFGMIYRINFD